MNQYDVGVDKWNKLYKELKDGLLKKYGPAGPSPRTGNMMPAVPWANAVAIGIQFAAWQAQALVEYGARTHEFTTPLLKTLRKPDDVAWPSVKAYGDFNHGYWDTVDAARTITRYLEGQVVNTGYLLIPHPIRNALYQRNLDATNRLVAGPYIVGINRDGGAGIKPANIVDVQWFGTGVREYQRLLFLPAECTGVSQNVRGAFGTLDAVSADMFLSRVFGATQTLAVRIPDVTTIEAIERMIEMTAEAAAVVVNVAAEAAGKGLNWTAEQLGSSLSSFLSELNIYGLLAVAAAGVYVMR